MSTPTHQPKRGWDTLNGDAGPPPAAPVRLPAGQPADRHRPLATQFLTNREREVLGLLVSAQSTARIADELGISLTTARGYVQSILAKLGVHSRVEAVAYAVQHCVVQGPDAEMIEIRVRSHTRY
jgi:DNA-binding CsgD family transcriptional regulator